MATHSKRPIANRPQATSLPHSARFATLDAMLLCPVRNCRMALAREKRRVLCPRGHSFDIARSGYINLLQPQDRRAKSPGDSAEVVAARRRFLERYDPFRV